MAEEKEADRRHGKEASPSGNMTPKRRTQAFWAAVLWPIPANLLVMDITLSMTRSYDSEWILYIAENQDTITQTMMVSTLLTTVIVAALGNKVQTLVAAVQPIIVQTADNAMNNETGLGMTILAAAMIAIPPLVIAVVKREELDRGNDQPD